MQKQWNRKQGGVGDAVWTRLLEKNEHFVPREEEERPEVSDAATSKCKNKVNSISRSR